MKNYIGITLLFVFCFTFFTQAQTTGKKVKNQSNQLSSELIIAQPSDAKANYIQNQNYLYSATSLKNYNGYQVDSLVGFNEESVKLDLLSRNFSGSEYLVLMNNLKRDFINRKYKIGPWALKPAQSPQIAYKPIGGGGNSVNVAPCVNEDFELTPPGAYPNNANAVTGWTIDSGQNINIACNPNSAWVPGSPEFSIVATPILAIPPLPCNSGAWSIDNVNIPNSPLGGTNVARLNDSQIGFLVTRMRTTFPVTTANTLFQFAYCGSWDGSAHACCDQPSFTIRLYDCSDTLLTCSNVSLTPSGPNCVSGVSGYSMTCLISWTDWVVKFVDLSPYIGSCVTIEVINSDCNGGAHHGTAYFDARCGGALVGSGLGGNGGNIGGPVSFCAGSNVAQIQAPLGYASYQWYDPSGNAIGALNGGNTPLVTITPAVPGAIYTVQLVTASGCTYTAVDTLGFSQVSIIGVGTTSSCAGGASGSATVQGNGSGAGYTYTWTNSSNVVVGSNSVAVNLPAGVYNAIVAASCGSSAVTVTVGVAPPTTYTIIQPFCGNEAYLYASGTNIQWYNGLAPISASLGGTSPGYTVTNPTNGQQIWLSYLSNQGCQDSVLFLLGQTPSGFVYADNTSLACQNQSSASATIVIIPSPGAPVGLSSYSVFSSAGFPNSIYTASLFPTSSNVFIPTGLAAGGYSITAFDGACRYTNSFTVTEYVYDYSVTPTSSTLCPNTSVLAGISFNAPITLGEYSFLWAPYQYMQPSNTDIAVVLTPTTALGTISNFVYSVTVVPALVYCPITKTISVTAVNLQTPTLSSIPEFCDNSLTKTVTVSQSGGTFSSGGGSVSWLDPVTGVIDPALTPIGTNTFVYSISVATCVVSNVGSFNVSQFNTAALSGTVPNLCVTNPCVNLMGIVQNNLGSWSGTNVNANVFCPTGLPTNTYVLTYDNPSNPNPFLCPDTQTLAVAVSQTVAPIISPVLPFCTNVPPINMTVTPSGGSWSWGGPNPPIGGPGINSTGLLNPANFPLGFTTLIYTVPTGACINTATTSISATLFRTAALTGSIANLCSNSPPINLMAIVQNTVSGVWSGSGVNSITGIFTPSMSVNMQNYGSFNYTLIYNTYSSPNPNVCPDSRTIVVNILNPAPPIIAPVGPICNADAPFQLAVTPNTGFFTITPYLTSGGLFTPSLCPVGNNLVEYTIGTNTCNVKDSKQISVEGFVPATITGSVSDQCNTNTAVNIANITLNSTGTWSGPGIVGTVFNPQNSGTGSIIITYNTSSVPSGLCPASENLAVNVYSLATPQVVPEGPFCNSGSAVKLRVSPLGGYFEGQNTPAIAPTGLFSPAAAVIGNNIIKYTVTSGPCIAYTEMIIKIEKFISADFLAHKLNYCKMENPLDLNSIAQNPGGLWTGPGVEGSIFTPYKANMGNNNIIIYQTHSLPTASLCPDTSATRLLVNDLLNVPIAANVKTGCAPVEVVFTSSSSEVDRGYWTLGDGSEAVDGLTSVHTYTASGTYSVVFNHWDAIGCAGQSILSTPITVYEQPVAAFSYGDGNNEVTISDPRVQFNNLSTVLSKNTYQWQIGNLYQLTDVNPLVVFPKIGKYEITLTATSVNSCVANTKQTIEVKNDFGVYIPNSFTPNADNLNDEFKPVFTPYGLDAKTFEMEIFDRWGTSLYSTKDVNKGWDGSVQNKGDNVLKQEVYVYKIKYKDLEGTIYNKLGYVTLAR